MSTHLRFSIVVALIAMSVVVQPLRAQEDVADVPSQELRVGNDEHKHYFLIGPVKGVAVPKKGHGLIVVLPGGSGDAEFHPFVKRIFKFALPNEYIVAQPVAVQWSKQQAIVWPTAKSRVAGMKFTTEEFIDAVIDDVAAKQKIDPERVFTVSWSSSGPAAYAASLTSKKVTGSFIAMSVFKPNLLPPLEKAKGHGYYLYHSPDDRVCPFRMAEQAAKDLEMNGAKVTLTTYDGGHGWHGPVYDEIRKGVQWLEKNHGAQALDHAK